MTTEWEPIRILDLDTRLSANERKYNFRLSVSPPPDWADRFQTEWRLGSYSGKKAATIVVNYLVLSPMIDGEELEVHFQELKNKVRAVNDWYRQQHPPAVWRPATPEEQEAARRRFLEDQRSKLNFDV